MTWGILLVCLLIHALVCLGIYLCRRAEILKFSSQAFPLVAAGAGMGTAGRGNSRMEHAPA